MYLVFDCETSGLYKSDTPPRLVQLAWQLHELKGALLSQAAYIVRPDGFDIPFSAEKFHGISTQRATEEGRDLLEVIDLFDKALAQAQYLVGHNLSFDIRILSDEYERLSKPSQLSSLPVRDTMQEAVEYVAIPLRGRGGYKFPKLSELYEKIFGRAFPSAHRADFDVAATSACFFELLQRKVLDPSDHSSSSDISYESPAFFTDSFSQTQQAQTPQLAKTPPKTTEKRKPRDQEVTAHVVKTPPKTTEKAVHRLSKLPFAHLHVHSQHSIISSTLSVKEIVSLAQQHSLSAVALCDMGNLCGAFSFVQEARKAQILAIVGCELFLSEHRKQHKFTREQPDRMYRQVLLAKNEKGYKNLSQLSTLGYTEGLYGIYPRIDKHLLTQHKEGLIALSGSLAGELPQLIIHQGPQRAEQALAYWIDTFGRDFYLEILRHGSEEEDHVNAVLLEWSQRHQLPILPIQEVFYAKESDQDTHDTLLCIKERLLKSAPIGQGRGKRSPIVAQKHHFSSPEEMHHRFSDLAEAFDHLSGLIDQIEPYDLSRKVLLPAFPLPDGIDTEINYLRKLAKEGLQGRYSSPNPRLEERLSYELGLIDETGYAGYFLIVHEIISQAKKMGIFVGPGRGSVAGSLVAYVLKITQLDPLSYGLMFERFLNPGRISMPDIDIDFDDEKRDDLIQWVLEHYGRDRVAQISTYGTMAARSSIRDCARVLEMPLAEADHLAKQIPSQPGYSLKKALSQEPLKSLRKDSLTTDKVLTQAEEIEGMIRNTGTHACGLIISPSSLPELVPLMRNRDDDLPMTQYDNSVVEEAGLLKMDFLGLRTLSILRTALQEIKRRHKKDIDIEAISLDDSATYELFQRAQTAGIFQFESQGMQHYLRQLKPDRFEDLIAMNALYRPGPLDYIDSFIARKHKKEEIIYDLPEMEDVLSETYGITVYQEQVMQLSEQLAGFTKFQADTLRYAMGKKKHSILKKLKPQFNEGFAARQHPPSVGEKIWKDWEAFASYAFNKSHAACYSLLAYQTAYLKANYPAEYMAALLTHHQGDVDRVAEFIEECRSLGLQVLPPDVNHSKSIFSVQDEKNISFGLSAIKGVGQGAAELISGAREEKGSFENIFDFASRLPSHVSKKTYQSLAQAGAFDSFSGLHRRQYLEANTGQKNLIEIAIQWSQQARDSRAKPQELLFSEEMSTQYPKLSALSALSPYREEEIFAMEKETVGVYISKHPLDEFRELIPYLCNAEMREISSPENLSLGHRYRLLACLMEYKEKKTKKGTPYGYILLEDTSGSCSFNLWRETHQRYKSLLRPHTRIYVEGHVEETKYGRQRISFEIDRMLSLPQDIDQLIRGITLGVPVSETTPEFFDQLEQILQKTPSGACSLGLHLHEKEVTTRMKLNKYRVKLSLEFFASLRALSKIDLQLELRPS